MTICGVGASVPVILVSLYGATDSSKDIEARRITADLLSQTLAEIEVAPRLPVLIMGDISCEIELLIELTAQFKLGTLHDIGSIPHLTGTLTAQPTCTAHGARQSTRRDVAICNSIMLPWIQSFTLRQDAGYDVHTPVRVIIRPPQELTVPTLRKPRLLSKPNGMDQPTYKRAIATHATEIFMHAEASFHEACHTSDSDYFWALWTTCME